MRLRRATIGVLIGAVLLPLQSARGVLCTIDTVPGATLLVPHFLVDLEDCSRGTTSWNTALRILSHDSAASSFRVTLWTDHSVPMTLEHPLFEWLSMEDQEKVHEGEAVYEDVVLNDVYCRPRPSESCWIVGEFGTNFRTEDLGGTWIRGSVDGDRIDDGRDPDIAAASHLFAVSFGDEREGLIEEPRRKASGYRQFEEDVIDRLVFIGRAKELGFTLKEIKELLFLRATRGAKCADVRGRAKTKIQDIEDKIRALRRMKIALTKLVSECSGEGAITECPILESLERNAK